MSEVNVIWEGFGAPGKGYWCYGWLQEVLTTPPTGPWGPHTFYHGEHISDVPEDEGAIVVLATHPEDPIDYIDQLNDDLAKLPWVVLILASDEQGRFPVDQLREHPNMALWVMAPHFEKHTYPVGTQFMGEMYPPQAREHILNTGFLEDRRYRWSFSGQVTHQRRRELVEALEGQPYGRMVKTAGFTQGLAHKEYYELLNDSISVAAPSGPVTPDSFRAFEALEAGAVPILDGRCPTEQDCVLYWKAVLGENHPLPVVHHWSEAIPIIENNSDVFPHENIRVYSWWQMYRRELRYRLLSGVPGFDFGKYTVLMPTSVIPSHPSLDKIEAVHASVRFHHPDADIIIMCDGVRDEQLHRTDDYEKYLYELIDACNFKAGWENTYPLVFESHQHQANMTRWALDYVHTPLILFAEHDIQMVTDMPIDWPAITALVESGDVDVVKFSFEAMGIHPEHEHMALDPEIVILHGCPVRRSVQWSQRVHAAKADYYRKIIDDWFPSTARTMIEDLLHSVAQQYPEQFILAMYMPDGSKVRCFHIDGREEDIKYEMKYE